MDDTKRNRERREQRRMQRLGVDHPACGLCGETDSRCLELHHIAGQTYDEAVTIVCRNCHRKLSDDQQDHPEHLSEYPSLLEKVGHFLLNLADFLQIAIEKLREFGNALIAQAILGVEMSHA